MKRILGLLLFVGVMLTTSCKTHKWRNNELEGSWRIESVAGIPQQTTATAATFMLGHDGRFTANSLPHDFIQLDDAKSERLYSGSGTWSLTKSDSSQEVRVYLIFKTIEDVNIRHLPYGAELFILGSSKKPRLFYFIGDPDENQLVIFRREPADGRATLPSAQ